MEGSEKAGIDDLRMGKCNYYNRDLEFPYVVVDIACLSSPDRFEYL